VHITCPSCKTTFALDEALLKSPIQKMRCSKCGHVFVYEKETPDAPAEPERHEEPAIAPVTEVAAETPAEEDRPKKKKGLLITLIVILVLAAVAAGIYYYWNEHLGVGDKWLRILKLQGQELITKEGKVFFISGAVLNGSTKPRKYVIVRTRLFDKESKMIAEKDSLAGLNIPKEELAGMWRLEMEKKINEFKQSKGEAFTVPAGREKPFSVVFFDDGLAPAKEFTVEITESPRL
jgi:predicted Zn finger-like uncharacterized protein